MEEYTRMYIIGDYTDFFCERCEHQDIPDWKTEPCKSCEMKKPTKFEVKE